MSTNLGHEKARSAFYTTFSSNGKTAFTIYLEAGKLVYFVTHQGKNVVATSRLGIKTDKVDYFDGLTFVFTTVTAWKTPRRNISSRN